MASPIEDEILAQIIAQQTAHLDAEPLRIGDPLAEELPGTDE